MLANDANLYLSNTLTRTFPRGFDFEIFSATALAEAYSQATELSEREHVTPYLYTGKDAHIRLSNISYPQDKSHYRITLDTIQDFRLIKILIEEYGAESLDHQQIISILDDNPELAVINRDVKQRES